MWGWPVEHTDELDEVSPVARLAVKVINLGVPRAREAEHIVIVRHVEAHVQQYCRRPLLVQLHGKKDVSFRVLEAYPQP